MRVQCAGVRGVRSLRVRVAGGGGHGWRGGDLARRVRIGDVTASSRADTSNTSYIKLNYLSGRDGAEVCHLSQIEMIIRL